MLALATVSFFLGFFVPAFFYKVTAKYLASIQRSWSSALWGTIPSALLVNAFTRKGLESVPEYPMFLYLIPLACALFIFAPLLYIIDARKLDVSVIKKLQVVITTTLTWVGFSFLISMAIDSYL